MSLIKKGRSLVDFYFKDFDVNGEETNIRFIEKLESIFDENLASWDENNPTFPIYKS
ncbi:Uncharacterised protein [Moraxella caviae]|uniref:Uncharacterized protein n=1 Tax=Moraxella caviae TaxID=34060 RepID=A0A378R5D5_9GAMM|nr:hypothetical protein [Moraxella caviae]STZ10434.1 Uncharacterised protein [Moraxella caviae]VEW11737.1 Uncharacterised protein [Moraxella caviae]